MKVIGFIIAGAIALAAQSAAASVVIIPSGATSATLDQWGQARTMIEQANPYTKGPVELASGMTFRSASVHSVAGYIGDYSFGSQGSWSGPAKPMAGLNAMVGEMTIDFQTPVSAVVAELNWIAGGQDALPVVMSIYNSAGDLLESFQLTGGKGGDQAPGVFGFERASNDIARLVLSNGKIGARDFHTRTLSRFSGFGPETRLSAPVPEPATWTMMILGFGLTGLMVRARRPAAARVGA